MREALIPAFLFVLGAVVLGSTVFHEQLVQAATKPFQSVVVTNTNTNSVPGSAGWDVNDERERNRRHRPEQELANIESDLGHLNFDSSGNLETTAQTASPGAVTEQCTDGGSSA